MADLYREASALGHGSLASVLCSEKIGMAHALLLSRFGKWAMLLAVVCELVNNTPSTVGPFFAGSTKVWVAASAEFILICFWFPGLHLSTLKKLAKVAEFWLIFFKMKMNALWAS